MRPSVSMCVYRLVPLKVELAPYRTRTDEVAKSGTPRCSKARRRACSRCCHGLNYPVHLPVGTCSCPRARRYNQPRPPYLLDDGEGDGEPCACAEALGKAIN